jgi:hypothetical protein
MRNMFDVSGLTTISYDSTLIGWKDQGVMGKVLNMNSSILIDGRFWPTVWIAVDQAVVWPLGSNLNIKVR